MQLQQNVSLAEYSTMRLGGHARYACEVSSEVELLDAISFAKEKSLKIHVVGGGSNTIFSDKGFDGLVIVNKITGIEVHSSEDALNINVGAGEVWDKVVELSVQNGFIDIAALSLIPGSSGAAPVQNIGAYGQQVSDSLVSLRAFDLQKGGWKKFLQQDCNFSYRTSRFNSTDKGQFIITSIELRLSRKKINPPFYKDVERYFTTHNISTSSIDAETLRKAIVAIRTHKLPDPSTIANTGSFFKNPLVTQSQFKKLIAHYPLLKAHQTDDGKLKLYAGQLIELAGLKNYHDKETGMATWKNQALVLVNEHAQTTYDLLQFKEKIITSVHAAFGVTLQQEPEFIQ